MGNSDRNPSGIFSLPLEVRQEFYKHLVATRLNKCDKGDGYYDYRIHLNFMRANKQIYKESTEVLRRENVFIHIDTPWQAAEEYVHADGWVPLVAKGRRAEKFKFLHLSARCELTDIPNQPSSKFIIALEDLPAFCKVWYYQDLTHLGMNTHFSLTLTLANPYSKDVSLPISTQRRLLLPFGDVKGLHTVNVEGLRSSTVVQQMKDAMAVPHESAESLLGRAAELKKKGDALMKAKQYKEAIASYSSAFEPMHIVVTGRRRLIFADGYFEKFLESGPYKGQHGTTIRFTLRIALVSCVIDAYLQLGNFEEARFWGQRSINIMRENFQEGSDRPHAQFPAPTSWGNLWFRTALACKALDDMDTYQEYCRIAAAWLPNDSIVQHERMSFAPRLL
ncbi:MAG: hypothetical protein M1828_007142 [Chrysothrix sp. TS-e1954]|nr:MAG: hypothetical protein M1828_007142 [Chrysothrix sp. TS-e1954]